jgi:putative membrane protein
MRAEADEAAIVAAIKAAEARSGGQILCILARSSGNAGAEAWLYASALALLTPWPLLAFTQMPAQHVFACQVAVFAAAWLVLGWTPLGLKLTPRSSRRRQAFRLAAEQFYIRGLAGTRRSAGVLIFVSLAEHYARILADDALTGKISEGEWQGAVDGLTAHVRAGDVTQGFVSAIDRVGDLLAREAPPDGGGNDLPDRLVRI